MAEAVLARQPTRTRRVDPRRLAAHTPQRGVSVPASVGHLQRTLGNRGMRHLLQSGAPQAKLTVGPGDDKHGHETGRVGDGVMRTADRRVGGLEPVPSRGEGQPLSASTRAYFEHRFAEDFSRVRVHSDQHAAQSARSVNALGYTAGSDIVFDTGRYAPDTADGKRLLAHELTHVVQQGATPAPTVVQRSCGPKEIGTAPPADCVFFSTVPPSENRFLFNVNCDTFASGQADALANFVRQIPPEAKVDIIGMASAEGGRGFNDVLSCRRAEAAKDVLVLEGLGTNIRRVLATGGVPETEHDPTFRAVQISMSSQPAEPEEVCRDSLGTCEYYLCRDRKHPCGDRGYYRGFGHKYCNRFTNDTRPRMTTTGQEWLDCVRNCLQEHLEQNVAVDADCGDAKASAIASHARCYVQCGLCSLPPGDLTRIQDAVDSEDKDLSQVLETIARCLTLPSPPATRGFQLECVMRLGGCSQTRPAGIPTPEEIQSFNDQCRRDIGFTGEDVVPSAEDCERFFGP